MVKFLQDQEKKAGTLLFDTFPVTSATATRQEKEMAVLRFRKEETKLLTFSKDMTTHIEAKIMCELH